MRPSHVRDLPVARRRSSAGLVPSCSLVALTALAVGCADAPQPTALPDTTPTPSELAGGVPAGALSRTHPVGGALSSEAPPMTRSSARAEGPDGFGGAMRLSSAPLPMGGGVTPRLASTLAGEEGSTFGALRLEGAETAAALVTGRHIVWQNTNTGQGSAWVMNGGTWTGAFDMLPTIPTVWRIAASADFNGDGFVDLVWQNLTNGDRSIWFMTGTGWPGSYALLPNVPVQWSIVDAGDFNADGNPDLLWQNTSNGDRSIWFMNGATWPGQYAALPNVSTQWQIAAVEDFNADNKPDLVWQNLTTGQRSVWFMNGSTWAGAFAMLPTIATNWSIAAAADFNADGQADLVWQNTTNGDRSIWYMNGTNWGGQYALLQNVPTSWVIVATASLYGSSAPSAPTAVAPPTQISNSTSQITLAWTRTATLNDAETRIERAAWGTTSYAQVGVVGSGTTTFTDAGLAASTRYLYRIRSCNPSGCSAYAAASASETGPASTTGIGNGTISNLSGTAGTSSWYRVVLPPGVSARVVTSGGTGNMDMNVWHGTSTRDCASASGTNAETCQFSATAPTTFYIQLFANTSFSGMSLTVYGAPTIATAMPANVTSTTADLRGDVYQDGNAYSVVFEWGTSPTLATYTTTAAQAGPPGRCPGTSVCSFTQAISGLTAGTTYYYRIVGTNDLGTTRSAIIDFTTP